MPADKPWDVVSVTRRSSGVAPRACARVYARVRTRAHRVNPGACARVYARVLVPPNLYIRTYIPPQMSRSKKKRLQTAAGGGRAARVLPAAAHLRQRALAPTRARTL